MMEKDVRGLEVLHRRGIRYPISYAGAEQDLTDAFPMSYGGMAQVEAIRGKDRRLLLGVTDRSMTMRPKTPRRSSRWSSL